MKRSRREADSSEDSSSDTNSDGNRETQNGATISDDVSAKGFSTAFLTIMNRQVGSSNSRSSVVMIEKNELLKKLDDDKKQVKAAKLRATKKIIKRNNSHIVRFDPSNQNNEKRLKRIATKGAVQLFNTVVAVRRRQANKLN